MQSAEYYMERCVQLARQGAGKVAPNPMVGAVLVYNDRIIGEGWHEQYGGPHAEVNCIASVKEADRHLISTSTIYVSLEPCAHFGKTPPCADLIIRHRIPEVVVGCRDPFDAVNGKGIEKLQQAGIKVTVGVSEAACLQLNERFFTYHTAKRPYIILKWAQTADGFIAHENKAERLLITNNETNTLVHKWRSEEAAILIGTHTALYDNPSLTNRLWTGNSPARLVIDKHLTLPATLHLFNREEPTIIFNTIKQEQDGNLLYYKITVDDNLVKQVVAALYQLKILSVIVEGGTTLLQSFIDADYWDEARVITNTAMQIGHGLAAPVLKKQSSPGTITLGTDSITTWKNNTTTFTA
jgi:diaminohydroxyphosphoribosylaminopyrimidine deaminase/5-amino-6-(5-phosphoribosylamino)uracil reductase